MNNSSFSARIGAIASSKAGSGSSELSINDWTPVGATTLWWNFDPNYDSDTGIFTDTSATDEIIRETGPIRRVNEKTGAGPNIYRVYGDTTNVAIGLYDNINDIYLMGGNQGGFVTESPINWTAPFTIVCAHSRDTSASGYLFGCGNRYVGRPFVYSLSSPYRRHVYEDNGVGGSADTLVDELVSVSSTLLVCNGVNSVIRLNSTEEAISVTGTSDTVETFVVGGIWADSLTYMRGQRIWKIAICNAALDINQRNTAIEWAYQGNPYYRAGILSPSPA